MEVTCLNCGCPYPETGAPYCCPDCGGIFDFASPLPREEIASQRTLAMTDVTLGEGNTPLLWAEAFGRQVAFKCEYQNPTGSFKDRGTAALVTFLKSRGVTEAVEDSSGNAGASFAAYAARAGIRARVFVPESASGPKRRQIEMYGAELVPVAGPRSNAAEAVKKAISETRFLDTPRSEAKMGGENGFLAYASHAYLPFNLPGYATIAGEIVAQLGGRVPGAVIVPAGQGGLLLGAWRGFVALNPAGATREAPRMIGVQAAACSPLVEQESKVKSRKSKVEGQTLAEGVRVANPVRREAVRKAVEESGGWWVAVDEKEILPGRDALAKRGFYVEPTSALVWNALKENLPRLPDPVVVILTGSGLKFFG